MIYDFLLDNRILGDLYYYQQKQRRNANMGYIESNLTADETVIARIRHSWTGLVSVFVTFLFVCGVGAVFLCMRPILDSIGEALGDPMPHDSVATIMLTFFYILGGIFILLGLLISIAKIAEIKCAQLVVTNKRMLGRRGFISKQTTDVILSKIDTINAGNGLFGAIFHYGYIQIVSPATQNAAKFGTMNYNYISNTMEFRKAVLDAIEKAKAQEREEQAKVMRGAMNSND